MNTDVIHEMVAATLKGEMPFPEIIANLICEGVEYYHVDYIASCFTFYSASGSVVVAPLALVGLPKVAPALNIQELKSVILDSQQNAQTFQQFCARAIQAGVQSYFAFLHGHHVLYLGRQGDQHVEWFPGVRPVDE